MWKPLADRVIVEPDNSVDKAGSIIIPETAVSRPNKGIIVAAGPGKKDEPLSVKEGDNIVYSKFAGTEIEIEGKKLLIMRESDILMHSGV